ncbi:MAG: HAD hydrolase-like protein, partial [Candidatus Saccharimonadales bacterium]
IHPWKMPFLLMRGRRRMRQVIGQLEPFAGIPEAIRALHAEGHELFILSSNTLRNVRDFLHQHELHTYFLEIYGSVGLFGKASALRRLLREHNLERGDAIYIGDETRDVQAAQSLSLRVIAVTWGFTKPATLKALHPTALADQPSDLIRILEEL